ncbi:MAG: hypothetical protein ACXABK_02030 [Candidatus Heimdallarchaeaceae archaeon]
MQLTEEWIYSANGGFKFFIQTLGISKVNHLKVSLKGEEKIPGWSIPKITFEEFLSSISHLSKKWFAYPCTSDEHSLSIVLEETDFDKKDITSLKNSDISTIVSFKLDTRKIREYQKIKLNYLFIPFMDFCNISLRKFSQVFQLETDKKVLFYPQETKKWITYKELKVN